MHFKPLRATLVFLAVAVLAACGGVRGTLPNAPTTANAGVGSAGSVSSACTHLGVPDASGHLRPEAICTAPPSAGCAPGTPSSTVACAVSGGGDGWTGGPNPGGGGAGCGTGGGQATLIARKSENGCGGTGGSPCDPISSCIAMRSPEPSLVCDGSNMELGDQYPGTTKDYAHEIVNIYPVIANNQTGNPDTVAWEYVMGNGTIYIEGNPDFQAFWDNVFGGLPFASAFESGGISSITSHQANQLESYVQKHNGYVGKTFCFSQNLPKSG